MSLGEVLAEEARDLAGQDGGEADGCRLDDIKVEEEQEAGHEDEAPSHSAGHGQGYRNEQKHNSHYLRATHRKEVFVLADLAFAVPVLRTVFIYGAL